jgi:small subunit ribosomal protein S2
MNDTQEPSAPVAEAPETPPPSEVEEEEPAAEAAPEEPQEEAPIPEREGAPVTLRDLLAAGVHFGHQTKRWNPKMRPYIFGARNGIHIVDLQQTLPLFIKAFNRIVETVATGNVVLFVGTKKQAQAVVEEEAARCGMYYVNNRWLGGTLTNWRTVRSSIEQLIAVEQKISEEGEDLTKKELLFLNRRKAKLERNLGGIKTMNSLPGAVIVIDPRKEHIAVAEANKLEIPVIALTDTNCNPDLIDYVVPGNDDAIRAIRLFASRLADACLVGQRVGRERAVVAARAREVRGDENPAPIRVSSGGDGPKVEVVSRRGPRPESDATGMPEEEGAGE